MYFDPTLQLHSARLVLSPIRASDGAALFAIQSDPAVMRYWNHPAWTDIKQAYAQILDDLTAMRAGTGKMNKISMWCGKYIPNASSKP